jgi:hypothetical protein
MVGCMSAVLGLAGCAMEQQQVQQQRQNAGPVDCRTAIGDLRVLQNVKQTCGIQ